MFDLSTQRSSVRIASGVAGLALLACSAAVSAAIDIIPQSALTPITQLYTDQIGGGIGDIAVMTGGGNANNAGGANGRNDDGFRGPINLGFSLPFFGNTYTQFFANNNGNISFNGGISAFVPTGPTGATQPTISIWFGDVDTRAAASGVMHIRQDIPNQLIVTWPAVGRYNARGDLLNTFQMVVRGPDYAIPVGEGAIGFFWLDMPWETTDTSQTAAVGFGDGAGNAKVLEGTNQSGLNRVVAFHSIWFDPNLRPIDPCERNPDGCHVPEPSMASLFGLLALVGLGAGLRRRGVKQA